MPSQWSLQYVMDHPGSLLSTFAVSPDETWFVATDDWLVQFRQGIFTEAYPGGMIGLCVAGDGQGVLVGGINAGAMGAVLRFDRGQQWDAGDSLGVQFNVDRTILTVFTAGSQTWAAGRYGALYLSPSWVAPPAIQLSVSESVGSGWGSAPDDFWVTTFTSGGGVPQVLRHHTDAGWAQSVAAPAGVVLYKVFGTPSGDVWVAGSLGTIFRVRPDGGQQQFDAGRGVTWFSGFAASDSEVFVGGDQPNASQSGVVARFNGSAFEPQVIAYPGIRSLHGTSATDVWAGDRDGGIWHFGPP